MALSERLSATPSKASEHRATSVDQSGSSSLDASASEAFQDGIRGDLVPKRELLNNCRLTFDRARQQFQSEEEQAMLGSLQSCAETMLAESRASTTEIQHIGDLLTVNLEILTGRIEACDFDLDDAVLRHDAMPDIVGEEEARAKAQQDTTTRALVADESTTQLQTALRVKRVRGREDKVDQFARHDEQQRRAREHERQGQQAANAFEAAVTQSSARERDGIARMRQRPEDFAPKYYQGTRFGSRLKRDAFVRRVQIQAERHPYTPPFRDSTWFKKTLEEISRATPSNPEHFVKRMETVRLPQGIRAVFKANAGEAILEVMLRTSSHLQIMPSRHDSGVDLAGMKRQSEAQRVYAQGFDSLSMYGSPEENEAAFKLLPDIVTAVSIEDVEASKDLGNYELRRERIDPLGAVTRANAESAGGPVGKQDEQDATYWREQDTMSEMDRTDAVKLGIDNDASTQHGSSPKREHEASPRPRIRSYWDRKLPSEEVSIFELTPGQTELGSETPPFRRPVEWTAITLANYVEALTKLPSRLAARKLRRPNTHQPGQPQLDTIKRRAIAEVIACFSNAAAAPYVSTDAVDTALRFFLNAAEYPAVGQLLAILEKHEAYRLTTGNFDVMLYAAAAKEDAHNYRLWLRNMLQQGLKPSWRTWVTLHQLVYRRYADTEWPVQVLNIMHQKGVLTNVIAMDRVVRNSIEHEFGTYLKRTQNASLDSFVQFYDDRFALKPDQMSWRTQQGKHLRPWLSVSAANIMAKILLAHGRTQEALVIVQMLEGSGRSVDVGTINTFLAAALRARDASFAVEILRHFTPALTREHRPVVLDQRSYVTLFHIAWRKQCLNMLRVVWRYACCAGHVDWAMQHQVLESLLSYWPSNGSRTQRSREGGNARPDDPDDAGRNVRGGKTKERTKKPGSVAEEVALARSKRGEVFFGFAGKFIVGVLDSKVDDSDTGGSEGLHSKSMAASENELLAFSGQPRTQPLGLAQAEPSEHSERRRFLRDRLDMDLTAKVRRAKATTPTPEMLERAWKLDMQWHKEGIGMPDQTLRIAMANDAMAEEEKAQRFGEVFKVLLRQGIAVPVETTKGSRT